METSVAGGSLGCAPFCASADEITQRCALLARRRFRVFGVWLSLASIACALTRYGLNHYADGPWGPRTAWGDVAAIGVVLSPLLITAALIAAVRAHHAFREAALELRMSRAELARAVPIAPPLHGSVRQSEPEPLYLRLR